MKISELMTRKPHVLSPTQTIVEAARLFLRHHIDGAPVVDTKNQLIGLIGKTQLYQALAENTALNCPIEKIMLTEVITCHPDDDIDTILDKDLSLCLLFDAYQYGELSVEKSRSLPEHV